jgi:hypothetical protein
MPPLKYPGHCTWSGLSPATQDPLGHREKLREASLCVGPRRSTLPPAVSQTLMGKGRQPPRSHYIGPVNRTTGCINNRPGASYLAPPATRKA